MLQFPQSLHTSGVYAAITSDATKQLAGWSNQLFYRIKYKVYLATRHDFPGCPYARTTTALVFDKDHLDDMSTPSL